MVSIFIRLVNAEKVNFDVDLQSTIKELKNVIATSQNLEAELITLVFKGKILKDEQTLEASNLIEGSVVHMVVMKKKAPVAAPKPAPAANPTPIIPETPKKEEAPAKPETPKRTFPSFGFSTPSSFGGFGSGFGGNMDNLGGMGNIDSATTKGMANMLKQNPEMFIELVKMDPGFRNVLEKNPQMEAVLHDPATIDYLLDVMSDPEAMKDAMRQADTAMNEIGNIPGGEAMLERVLSQYYEPVDKARDSKQYSRPSNTSAGNTQETTVPNLWGSAPASTNPFQRSSSSMSTPSSTPSTPQRAVASPTSPLGSSFGGLDAMNDSNMDFISRMMSTNPELVSNLIKMTPEYQQMAQSNPAMAELMTSPEYLKQAFTPEMLALARQLQGSGMGGMNGMGSMGGFGDMGGFGGMGGFGMPQQREQLTSEQIRERYPTQIAQIEEMGFIVDDNALQILHRFNGNVDRTIDYLINYACLFNLLLEMDKLPILLDKVKQQCPILCPVFYPGEVTEKQVMKMLKDKKRVPKPSKKCAICESHVGEMKPQVICDYDVQTRKMIVKDVKCVCSSCKNAMDIQKVMNLLINSPNDSEEVDTFIRHFLLVNGHKPDNIALMEEIISSCYSLHIILKGLLSSTVDL